MTLGEKLRKMRLEKGMTLQNVAEKTGYSKALISRIENDSVSPSISSLIKIAGAVAISLHQLFTAVEGGHVSVIKKSGRKSSTLSGGKIKVEYLSQGPPGSKMESVIKTFEAGAASEDKRAAHIGEEWLYVLKGKLEALVEEEAYDLNEGDCMYVKMATPHKWRNAAKGRTTTLVVSTPPSS
ncbi:helix-turn-helix transcriptional regulator [Candidatus Poribacteria bacterium]|nr:helix-turn-helix transcriptional regulator [Candidatus Poribacteria bacterium]